MARKTEAEQREEAEREAQATLQAMPEPVSQYVTGSVEDDEAQAAAELAAEEQAADADSDTSAEARILRLEQLFEENTRLLRQLLEKNHTVPLILPASADALPRKGKDWTQEELETLVSITIFPESDPHMNRPVDVALNGTTYSIPRGEPYRVPRAVVLVLEAAVIESWEHPIENGLHIAQKTDLTPLTTTPPVLRRYPRFNFALS